MSTVGLEDSFGELLEEITRSLSLTAASTDSTQPGTAFAGALAQALCCTSADEGLSALACVRVGKTDEACGWAREQMCIG